VFRIDSLERPTLEELQKHPFFMGVDWSTIHTTTPPKFDEKEWRAMLMSNGESVAASEKSKMSIHMSTLEDFTLPDFVEQNIAPDDTLPEYMKPPDGRKTIESEKVLSGPRVVREEKITKRSSGVFKWSRVLRLTNEPRLL